jgi:hypothetical protein
MSFTFKKPDNWSSMPLYMKIKFYKTKMNADYAPYVDKLKAKEIVTSLCTDIKVARVIRILDGPNDFTEADINDKHMIKATHGSGWNINMNANTSVTEVKKLLNKWNCIYNPVGELQYQYIIPRFFIEEKIDGVAGNAIVYMIRCIHKKPVTIGVKLNNIQNSYDIDWNIIGNNNLPSIQKPECLPQMLKIAELLSAPFEFVRIDFYIENNSIYFSEYTFTPAGGAKIFSTELEMRLGELWTK